MRKIYFYFMYGKIETSSHEKCFTEWNGYATSAIHSSPYDSLEEALESRRFSSQECLCSPVIEGWIEE